MARIFDALRGFLDGEGLLYQVVEGATAVTFGFRTESHQWMGVAEAREDQDLLIVWSAMAETVPEDRRAAVVELITRLNYGLAIGNFELSLDDGEARFRTSIDVEGAELQPALIRQLVRANISTFGRYVGALEQVAAGADPRAALEEARRPRS